MRTRSPHAGNEVTGTRVKPEKYGPVKDAILRVLPTDGAGLTLLELEEAIEPLLDEALFPKGVRWYMMAVKLDLEAQGVVERVPKSKPLRHRRVA